MSFYEYHPFICIPTEATQWRDAELARTDILVATPDHPERDNILLYRTALRNWPAATDEEGEALFPNTRPVIGE